jgi:hypothetical protein
MHINWPILLPVLFTTATVAFVVSLFVAVVRAAFPRRRKP